MCMFCSTSRLLLRADTTQTDWLVEPLPPDWVATKYHGVTFDENTAGYFSLEIGSMYRYIYMCPFTPIYPGILVSFRKRIHPVQRCLSFPMDCAGSSRQLLSPHLWYGLSQSAGLDSMEPLTGSLPHLLGASASMRTEVPRFLI